MCVCVCVCVILCQNNYLFSFYFVHFEFWRNSQMELPFCDC